MAAAALVRLRRAPLLPPQSDVTRPTDMAGPSQYVPGCALCSLFDVCPFSLGLGAISCG